MLTYLLQVLDPTQAGKNNPNKLLSRLLKAKCGACRKLQHPWEARATLLGPRLG